MNDGADIIVGRLPALAALRLRRRDIHRVLVLESGKGLEPIVRAAGGVPVKFVSRNELTRRAQTPEHQGVLVYADPLPLAGLEEVAATYSSMPSCFAVLDGIEDPHNFGAIIRSAVALGVEAVVFGKERAAPLTPAVYKAAAGATESATLVQVPNIPRALDQLKSLHFHVRGLDMAGTETVFECSWASPTALVLGSEGRGLRPFVRQRCDTFARIPIQRAIGSLNVSVSAAVAFAARSHALRLFQE